MKFESKPDDVSSGGLSEEMKKDAERMRITGVEDLFSTGVVHKTGLENLISTLRKYSEQMNMSFEIETLETLRLWKALEDVEDIRNSILNSDSNSLQKTIDHQIYDLAFSLKKVSESLTDLRNAVMDLLYKISMITGDFNRAANALDAQGRTAEADTMWEEKKAEYTGERRKITKEEIDSSREELLQLVGRIESEKQKVFGEDFTEVAFQKELNKTKESIKLKFQLD